jgi:hypothetical protein
MKVSMTDVATTIRTRSEVGEFGWEVEPIRSFIFLAARPYTVPRFLQSLLPPGAKIQ